MNDCHTDLQQEMHRLLDQAAHYADDASLARLHSLLVYLSEGADLLDYRCDVPAGLEHKPVFKRMLMCRNLLDEIAAGCA